ncbi:MAG: M48 family peptidase, partial [Advenella sp.]
MSPTPFTLLFVLFLLLETVTHLWLASRQARHVTRHRARVPDEFAEKIGLHSHQRAADYTVERMKLSMTRRVFDAMVLIAFTLLGGLQLINEFLINTVPGDFWRQILLLGTVLLISGALH